MLKQTHAWLVGLLILSVGGVCIAGVGFGGNSVGGIIISPDGVLNNIEQADLARLNAERELQFQPPPTELSKPVELRKISLKAIETALNQPHVKRVQDLPDEIKYLAGIQRIQYVFLYPESNDIVLAGPGEGWKLDGKGNMVGVTTDRPVLYLEDLLVAFRTTDEARRGGISCSIDPTMEGRQRFEQFMKQQTTFSPEVVDGIERAMGNQKITVTGVPETSHFARVLVAADYKMKRIGMKLDRSPVRGLVSFIDMIQGPLDNMMPRWWMACHYDAIGKSEDGLSWELRGTGVKCLTEDEFVDNDAGTVKGTGKANPVAQKWCDQFTAKYDELAAKESVFGDLRNLMDMSVIAALIRKEGLLAKANCDLPTLTNGADKIALDAHPAPKLVPTESSALKRGRNWILTASGGVAINSWEVADKTEVRPAVGVIRERAKATKVTAWWN